MGDGLDILERLRFDAARCEASFSKGVASNIEEGIAEITKLRGRVAELDAKCTELFIHGCDQARRLSSIREEAAKCAEGLKSTTSYSDLEDQYNIACDQVATAIRSLELSGQREAGPLERK